MPPGSTYMGLEGGLYSAGSNVPPAAHDSAGRASGALVQPINDKIVVLCLGFSSVGRECSRFQAEESGVAPDSRGSVRLPRGVSSVEIRGGIILVNGAQSGANASAWDQPTDLAYNVVRDEKIPAPYTEADVQVVWMQLTNVILEDTSAAPPTLPDPDADAWRLRDTCPAVMAALRTRYPNLRQVFLSAKQYTGYSVSGANREPYAYEGAFGLRECVLAHQGPPFLGWGPYLWDSSWPREDYVGDGIHPSDSGLAKVAAMLRGFLETSPYTPWWSTFPAGGESPDPPPPTPTSTSIELTATGQTRDVRRRVILAWNGANGDSVEIRQDGQMVALTANDGVEGWRLPDGATGTYGYSVCEAGGATCSAEVFVTF